MVIESGTLVASTEREFLVEILTKSRREIEHALKWQGLELGFEVRLTQKEKSKQDADLEKLNELKDYIKIKGDKNERI